MPEPAAPPTEAAAPPETPSEQPAEQPAGQDDEVQDPKAVLQSNVQYRRENKGLRAENKRLAAELEAKQQESMTETEKAVQAARKEEQTKHQRSLVQERVIGRAAQKLTDPEDAARYLDLDGLTLDNAAIDKAIDELLAERPYLRGQPRVPTTIDQGARGPALDPTDPNEWLRRAARG